MGIETFTKIPKQLAVVFPLLWFACQEKDVPPTPANAKMDKYSENISATKIEMEVSDEELVSMYNAELARFREVIKLNNEILEEQRKMELKKIKRDYASDMALAQEDPELHEKAEEAKLARLAELVSSNKEPSTLEKYKDFDLHVAGNSPILARRIFKLKLDGKIVLLTPAEQAEFQKVLEAIDSQKK